MEQDWEFIHGVFSELLLSNVFFSFCVARRTGAAELILGNLFMDWSEVLFSPTALHRYVETESEHSAIWSEVESCTECIFPRRRSRPFVICIFINFTSAPAAAKTNRIRLEEQEALFCFVFFFKEKWYESVNYPQEVLH